MSDDEIPVRCPACSNVTVSLKRYEFVKLLVFVGIFVWHQRAVATQCGACMRKMFLWNTLVNIVPANVFWLVVILPVNTVQVLRSFTKGHSSAVLAELRARG